MKSAGKPPSLLELNLPECHGCSACGDVEDIEPDELFILYKGLYYCKRCFFGMGGPGRRWPRP